jgi:hypothetical protein
MVKAYRCKLRRIRARPAQRAAPATERYQWHGAEVCKNKPNLLTFIARRRGTRKLSVARSLQESVHEIRNLIGLIIDCKVACIQHMQLGARLFALDSMRALHRENWVVDSP